MKHNIAQWLNHDLLAAIHGRTCRPYSDLSDCDQLQASIGRSVMSGDLTSKGIEHSPVALLLLLLLD